jgi:two-component system, sensor histidine kinase and response regulator
VTPFCPRNRMSDNPRGPTPYARQGTADIAERGVAERRQTDESVQRSQTLLRMAGRLSRLGAWSVELPALTQTWSDEVCAIHEVPPGSAFTVDEGIRYYAPEFRDAIARAFGDCARAGTPFDVELQIITARGRRVWVRAIGEAERDAGGVIRSVQGAFQDISERKAAEAETRALAERLTTTLESLTDGFFTLDREWRFTYVNREAERLFILPRAELLGHHIWEKFPEARGTISHLEYERALRDNVAVQFETFYPPLGTWFDARAFPSTQGLAVYFRDITAVRRAGDALRTNEERFRLLAKATNDAIRDWDLATNALWWNEGFEALFGYQRAEVDSTVNSWTDYIHPDDLIRVTNGIHHVIETGGEGWTDEYRFRRRDGRYAYVLDRGHVIRNTEGKGVRLIGGMTDVTERRQTENALRESNAKFHLVADNITDAFWIRSPDMREVHYISPAFERIWGRSAESLYAHPEQWASFTAPEDRERVVGAFGALSRDAPRLDIEYRIRRPDGEIRWVRVRGFQVRDAADTLIRLIGVVTDITEGQRAADALRTSMEELSRTNRALQAEIVERKRAEDAADAANRSKSEFLANMSHEIRTPLNGVVGMTELALGTDLSTEQREYLDIAKASGESLLTVINDILDFSKIEAGQLAVDVLPFDLNDCLTTTLKPLAMRAHLKGLELASDVRPDVPTALLGDPGRLRQIITNLVGNAIKFTARGEVVLTVDAGATTGRDAILQFSVSDTGIGVPREQQQAIFKPFVQADGSTTRTYGGTGLGLAISTNLVALLGGRIWLESEIGTGSTFHFAVPFDLQQTPVPATMTRDARMVHLRDVPILVVDDNLVHRRILEATLRRWLMEPVLAGTGRAAVAAMQERKMAGMPFPLVLLDAQMSAMDGFSVAEEIQKDPELAGATVLMLTSAGQQGDAPRCRALEVAASLTKPISQVELLEAILAVRGMPSDTSDRLNVAGAHSVPRSRRTLRILLAEDNEVNQMVAARLLGKRGHTVVVARNGREALAALDDPGSGGFDLVLMDVQMPDLDGFEATGIIRAKEKSSGTHLPIIAMTAHAIKGDEERCLAAGMDGYTSKPIHVDVLLAMIDRVLG